MASLVSGGQSPGSRKRSQRPCFRLIAISVSLFAVFSQPAKSMDSEVNPASASEPQAATNSGPTDVPNTGDAAGDAANPAPGGGAVQPESQGFWGRFVKAYLDDWHPGPDT